MVVVVMVGLIFVVLDVFYLLFQFYKFGVYDEFNCFLGQVDYFLVVVGYGLMDGKKYWIVKNRYIFFIQNVLFVIYKVFFNEYVVQVFWLFVYIILRNQIFFLINGKRFV